MRLKSAGFEDGQIVLAVRLNPVTQLTHHLDHDYPLLVFCDGSSRASVDRRCNRACERFDLRLESRQIKRRIRKVGIAGEAVHCRDGFGRDNGIGLTGVSDVDFKLF